MVDYSYVECTSACLEALAKWRTIRGHRGDGRADARTPEAAAGRGQHLLIPCPARVGGEVVGLQCAVPYGASSGVRTRVRHKRRRRPTSRTQDSPDSGASLRPRRIRSILTRSANWLTRASDPALVQTLRAEGKGWRRCALAISEVRGAFRVADPERRRKLAVSHSHVRRQTEGS